VERDIDKQSERNSLEIEEIVIGESARKREKVTEESERKHER
jgi:hypothetical protein